MSSCKNAKWCIARLVFLLALYSGAVGGQGLATIRGHIVDQLGAVITGVRVTLTDRDGRTQTAETDGSGLYQINGVGPGTYTLVASQKGFATYQETDISLAEGRTRTLDIKLLATVEGQTLTIAGDGTLSGDPGSNRNAIVFRGRDLDTLPDDPEDLTLALQTLIGTPAGPNGEEIYTDGFSAPASTPPDKQTIREITINRNPFSAEYDRIGFSRIDVQTKAGTGKIHGGADINFTDAVLNSRNPYADERSPYQRRIYSANVSGPLVQNRASFFFSINKRDIDESAVINATILDDSFRETNFKQTIVTPERFIIANPRVDLQLNSTNVLTARFVYNTWNHPRSGIGDQNLESVASNWDATIGQFNLTETSTLSPKVVNDARFQYFWWRRSISEVSSEPQINVLDAFTGGGGDSGKTSYLQHEFELHNYSTIMTGRHTFKFGGRFRFAFVTEADDSNHNGQFVFSGRSVPGLDQADHVVTGSDGKTVLVPATSLEIYRRTLLFHSLGLPPDQIRQMGGGPSQLMITIGMPLAKLSQYDFGGFIQDDWKLRPDFTLSMGLRYQKQTNAHGYLNFAPRAAFAWVPWTRSTGQSRTVIRGGIGIFYDLIRTDAALDPAHLNGINEKRFIVTNPQVLDLFPVVPSRSVLETLPSTTEREAPNIKEPYTIQSSISVEQSLTNSITVTGTYLNSRGLHFLRTRNINAPLPGSDVGPLGTGNGIYEIESSGVYRQNLLIVNTNVRAGHHLTLSGSYALGFTNSDTDTIGTFPSNSYDLTSEYGRARIDIRHRFTLYGNIDVPWGITISPYLYAQSGPPFNITTGVDNNSDSVFQDRPAFATDLTRPSVVVTPFGAFDIAPLPGAKIIPRNFGQSPGYVSANMRVTKAIILSGEGKASSSGSANSRAGGHTIKLVVGVYGVNIFNHTNPGAIEGNLSSPVFGTSTSLQQLGQRSPSSNRSLNLVMALNF
jgi:hypothetical protein